MRPAGIQLRPPAFLHVQAFHSWALMPPRKSKASSTGSEGAAGEVAQKRRKAGPQAVADGDSKAQPSATGGPAWYLMKSEPDEFSVEDLQAKPNMQGCWEGVRNAQARNFMKGMKIGDQILFYYSSCKEPGIVAIAEVVAQAYPDHTAWDKSSKYFDEKRWMVDIQFKRKLHRFLSLRELKEHKDGQLQGMLLFNRPRLSVQPVTQEHVDVILELEQQQAAE